MFKRYSTRQADSELRRAHGLVDKVTSIVSYSAITAYTFDIRQLISTIDATLPFAQIVSSANRILGVLIYQQPLAIALSITTLVWMLRYKAASRNEIEILVGCFSRMIPLPEWKALHGSMMARILAAGLVLTFLLLAALVTRIELYALVVFVWAIGDLIGNAAIQRNILLLFRDKRYEPPNDDPLKATIIRRRAVAEAYWIGRPQLVRITFVIAAIGMAIVFTGAPIASTLPYRVEIAYVIVTITVLLNTSTMALWRHPRDIDLSQIDTDEATILAGRVRT